MATSDGGVGYTSGPWAVWNDSVYAGPFKKVHGGISGYRAEICRLEEMDIPSKVVKANGRLIAVAPTLLDAATLAEEALVNSHADMRHYHEANARHEAALAAIRAALLAARGNA